MAGTLTSAFAGKMWPTPELGPLVWLLPPAPGPAPPAGPTFSEPPNRVVNPAPVPVPPVSAIDSCTVRPGRESRVPTFVTSTFAGHAARETEAVIVSPLRLSELGGNSPTPGFTTWSMGVPAMPGLVPWKGCVLATVPPGVPKIVMGVSYAIPTQTWSDSSACWRHPRGRLPTVLTPCYRRSTTSRGKFR
jgi:hypothetical protein